MIFVDSFTKFKNYIKLDTPINIGKAIVVGYFPYSVASITNAVPKISRSLFSHIEQNLDSIMDNKIVVICQDQERFGTEDFAIEFHDSGVRIGKLKQVIGYSGELLLL